jgi:hypothetical protein
MGALCAEIKSGMQMKTLYRHIIILFGLLAVCLNIQAKNIYWKPQTGGSDSNNGETEDKAVSSFSRAKELVTSADDWIILLQALQYTSSGTYTLDGSKGSYNVRVKRKDNTTTPAYMIEIGAGVTLTLKNITISGGFPEDVHTTLRSTTYGNSIIYFFSDGSGYVSSTLNIETGTVIKDSWGNYGGAIKMYRGNTINMTGGEFYNCGGTATGGAIYLSAYRNTDAVFNMSGGTIKHCRSVQGGGAVSFSNFENASETGSFTTFGHITFNMSGTAKIEDCIYKPLSVDPADTRYYGGGAVAIYQVAKENDGSHTYVHQWKLNKFEMTGGTISNCHADSIRGFGGAIFVNNKDDDEATPVIISGNAMIKDCDSEKESGGGIYMQGKTSFSMNGGTIMNCSAPLEYGGGIFITGDRSASFELKGGAVIDNCDSYKQGGGVFLNKTITSCVINDAEIKNCDCTNNSGGGLHINSVIPTGGTYPDTVVLELKKAKIHDNTATTGGAIDISIGKFIMDADVELYENVARTGIGGAMNLRSCHFIMNGGKVYNNHSATDGGAIHLTRSAFILHDGEFYGNYCSGTGGVIHFSYCTTAYEASGYHAPINGRVTLNGGKFHNNKASRGGCLNFNTCTIIDIPSTSTIEMYDNEASSGGVFSVDGAELHIAGGTFHGNTALETCTYQDVITTNIGKGGVILCQTWNGANKAASLVRITGGNFYDNEASQYGGCAFIKNVDYESATSVPAEDINVLEIQGGEIYDNRVGEAGGAIYFEANTKLKMQGTVKITDNWADRVPNNIYLLSDVGQTIEVTGTFTPQYVGIFPNTNATLAKSDIPVFEGTQGVISDLNTGIGNYTYKVVDDKQLHRVKYPGSTILYFGIDSPWSPLQQTVRKTADLDPILHNGVYEISNVKQLTAYLWYVNGIDTHDSNFSSVHPGAMGKLIADIDMEDHHWESIGDPDNSSEFTGTFDGNGYIISHLNMVPTNPSSGRGMFGTNTSGTIKNVILRDSYMAASTGYVGIVVCQNNGTLSNSVAEGEMVAAESGVIMGGLAGLNGGTIHSSFATPEMYGYTMGGLVGENTSNLYNSFANAKFTYRGTTQYMGGLVGVNTGTVENGYVQLRGDAPASNFGWLVGDNTDGTLNFSYSPNATYTVTGKEGTRNGLGTYGATSTPYLYNHRDNQVDVTEGSNPYVSSASGADKQMLIALNSWVADPDHASSNYTYWLRTTTKTINDDLPLLRLPATNAVAATNGEVYLDYNQVNELLTGYTTDDKAICLYGAEASMNGNAGSAAPLYIDQEATLKQSGSKGAINARTSQMLQTYTAERWHHFSSPLTHSDIGFTYHNASPVPYAWGLDNPCSVTINGDDDHSLFPSNLLDVTSFYSVDLFCFYEPEYHWLNLKRASDSHWHMNATEEPIAYNGNGIGASTNGNETYLVPGKGYLISVDVDQLVQNYGTLNDGDVTLYSVTKSDYNAWAERLGFNLLGNPYQSYLDFEEFKTQNGTNLWASSADIYEYTYAVFDPQLNAYRQYKDGSSVFSNAASRYIHPHQGFFIRMTKGTNSTNTTTVTYTNDMRVVTLPENVTSPYRGATQPAFPLINLVVSDSEGNADLAVLELDRDNDEGAEKIRLSEGKGLLSLGYEGRDYGILFRTKIEDYQPLRFEALEEGTFTLEWSTANGEFSELTLIDNIAGTTTDMLSRDSYSFEANPDQYASRFKIVIGHYKDVEEHEDGPSTGSETFAFQMGEELIVNGEGTLQMFDVTGRLLMQTSLHGSQTNIALPEVSAGVYVLHLANDRNGMKTQKIILE